MTALDSILTLGTTMRLTRLVTLDDLGEWTLNAPAHRWAATVDPDGNNWETKAVDGLDCPFCVGFWIGAGVLLIDTLAPTNRLWRFTKAAFTLNYVAAHLGSRIDVVSEES